MAELYLWIGSAVAALAVFFGAYLRGRSTGAKNERQERETAVTKQQSQAQQTKQEVNDEVAQMDDTALRDRASKWMRNK